MCLWYDGMVRQSCYFVFSLKCFWWHGVTVLLLCLQSEMFLVAWCDSPVTLFVSSLKCFWWHGLTVLLLCLQSEMFLVAWLDSPFTYSPAWDISGGMFWQSCYFVSSLRYFWWHGLTVLLLYLQPGMFGGIVWQSCYFVSSLGCFWWCGLTVLLLCLQTGLFLTVILHRPDIAEHKYSALLCFTQMHMLFHPVVFIRLHVCTYAPQFIAF